MSDSPGSFSTNSNCPLRYVRGTAAPITRWRTSGSNPANISTPVKASPGSGSRPSTGPTPPGHGNNRSTVQSLHQIMAFVVGLCTSCIRPTDGDLRGTDDVPLLLRLRVHRGRSDHRPGLDRRGGRA